MNAKKIMGAVLVALLAAALFVGAGAAADPIDKGTIFAYTELNQYNDGDITFADGMVFTVGDESIAVVMNTLGKIYFAATEDQLGKQYVGEGITFKLAAPTAVISALGPNGASIFGATITKTAAESMEFDVSSALFGDADVVFIKDGVKYAADTTSGKNKMPAAQAKVAGKWGVAADLTNCANLTANAETLGQIYYFTIAKTENTITAAQDTVIQGDNILITVTVPGATTATIEYGDKVQYFDQAGVSHDSANKQVKVNLTLAGTATVAFKAIDTGKATFTLVKANDAAVADEVEVTVTIAKGSITAVADEDFFYIGNPIYISGETSTENLFFYIEGTNFGFMQLTDPGMVTEWEVEDGKWTAEIDSSKVINADDNKKVLITGTYSIIVSNVPAAQSYPHGDYKTMKEHVMSGIYGTAAVTMKLPFITDVEAAAVAVQGTDFEITGTAISAKSVNIYIFGTNYFYAENVETDDEVFEFEIEIPEDNGMAPGTYFYLIQHPMNDELFNVWNSSEENEEAAFYYAATTGNEAEDATLANDGSGIFIFDAWKRGTNYAAQALLEEISGQNIDDIFVQGTFEVEAQKLTINAIPAEVAKGTKLAITGSTNSGEGVEVIVNVLAGKFGATVKGDENAATFLTAKAVTEEDGTFEAAIDTSKLELGSYIVTVEIAGTMYDSAAVEIVDKAPETPVDPVDPVDPKPVDPQPTEPETPGFGALAALAGLGAVAVLLLRRE